MLKKKEIKEILDEGLEEEGTVLKAFDYLLENYVRELFDMDEWDVPETTSINITFKDKNYKVSIFEGECIEATHEHRIMEWSHTVEEIAVEETKTNVELDTLIVYSKQLNKIKTLEQTQVSLSEQLKILIPFANKLGLYDAADFLKNK